MFMYYLCIIPTILLLHSILFFRFPLGATQTHDGRKHFVTMAKKYGVDEYAIKYLVGHKISDITEKVYTAREFEWLREEIEKIG